MFGFSLRGRRHWQRYREIAQTLLRHGFDQIIDVLELAPFVSFPARWLRKRWPNEQETAPQRLRHVLESLGPTFVKLGQILSTRPDLLPNDYYEEMTKLQDSAPPFGVAEARSHLVAEWGQPVEQVLASFDEVPIAAASLSQVHRAVLRDGTRVVVKIQRPHIERIINTDLEILLDLAGLAQNRTSIGEHYDLVALAEEFSATLRDELDYRREGRNADRFRRNFEGDPTIVIPRIDWGHTTSRVLVMEEIHGVKINDIAGLDRAGVDRHSLALESARLLVKQVFVDSFFHADPHPGNFYVLPPSDGLTPRIGVMDFGMVGWIDRTTREHLLRLMVALVRENVEGIVDEFLRMGVVEWGNFDRRGLEQKLQQFLTRYRGQSLQELRARDLFNDWTAITFRFHLHFPSELWLLGKTLAMSEGVGLTLDPEFDMFRVAEPFARELYLQTISPADVGKRTAESLVDWTENLLVFPQQMRRMVERLERGSLQITVREEGRIAQVDRLDRMASRLAASILIAALIVAVSIILPLLASDTWRLVAVALILLGFVNATVLTLWLLISSWPGARKG